MANSEAADLMSVGQHCAHTDCRQLDFLPFKCSRCSQVYCLDHRACPCAGGDSKQVVVCPLCARAVIISQGEDVELVFERHTRTDCDPSNYDRVHRKPRCPAGTCKEKLTSTNTYTCRDCGITVCLKHRLPADHACPGRAAAAAAAAAAAKGRLSLSQSLRRMLSGNGGGGAAQRPASAGSNGSGRTGAVARATAAAVRTKESVSNQLQQYRQRQRAGAPPGGSGGSTAPAAPNSDVIDLTSPVAARPASGAEECPQCGARFASVQQLIEHAETAHAGGWSSGAVGMQHAAAAAGPASGGALERCPHCSQQFSDPVELVAHVERRHGAAAGGSNGSALDNCVLC
ncbi:zinc finger AN1 and C2H2 domain-containing stress-associated 16 [Micractinium conductrix]|uniref:Zinc finger AN1 and C2H2 domain-containing stress-associated 16 n=1 Tax=Micractinium conductrix TaxID=554055 RepID=A0A2P6VNA8_9CHLO|nr:zinc finger AN1 and C2H2 domain-containing stress-associated 16 [Micractinium conductrix]|eukprot:PSC75576.1 zinc finger AN1 and C2H2 domain-containing stress-associated 16 [Micractinium conductrix]